jgi:hypothetical protein
MTKNFDTRVDDVLTTIKTKDAALGGRIETYYHQQTETLRKKISAALSFGWRGPGEKDAGITADRALKRAIILLRMLFDGLEEKAARADLGEATTIGLNYLFDNAVRGAGRRSFTHQLDLSHMRGRMELLGMVGDHNRNNQWFTDQFALFDHFENQIPMVHAQRQGVYREALLTAGLISWAPNEPNATNAGRFDQFDKASALCRQPSGATMQLNCWEAILFWTFRAGFLTAKKAKNLYSKSGDKIGALFGTEAAFDRNLARPGDIITYVNSGHVNHTALYAGIGPDNEPYVFHCLSTDANTAGGNYATTHFISNTDMLTFYRHMYGPATAYHNTPFWMPTSTTHAYYQSL